MNKYIKIYEFIKEKNITEYYRELYLQINFGLAHYL